MDHMHIWLKQENMPLRNHRLAMMKTYEDKKLVNHTPKIVGMVSYVMTTTPKIVGNVMM